MTPHVGDAIALGRRLLTSMLAPCQRLDAVKTFLCPALNFAMGVGAVGKDEWKRLYDALRPLCLPGNASNDYIYGSAAACAAVVPVVADISDTSGVDGAFKLRSSPDAEMRELVLRAVLDVVSKRLRRQASPLDVDTYLTGETEGEFRSTSTQIESV